MANGKGTTTVINTKTGERIEGAKMKISDYDSYNDVGRATGLSYKGINKNMLLLNNILTSDKLWNGGGYAPNRRSAAKKTLKSIGPQRYSYAYKLWYAYQNTPGIKGIYNSPRDLWIKFKPKLGIAYYQGFEEKKYALDRLLKEVRKAQSFNPDSLKTSVIEDQYKNKNTFGPKNWIDAGGGRFSSPVFYSFFFKNDKRILNLNKNLIPLGQNLDNTELFVARTNFNMDPRENKSITSESSDDFSPYLRLYSYYSSLPITGKFTNDAPLYPRTQSPQLFKYGISGNLTQPELDAEILTKKLVKSLEYFYGDYIVDQIQMRTTTNIPKFRYYKDLKLNNRGIEQGLRGNYQYVYNIAKEIVKSRWYWDPKNEEFNTDYLETN